MDLNTLLTVTMTKITEFMEAERSTLFLYDAQSDELWARYAQGQTHTEWLINPQTTTNNSAEKRIQRNPVFTEIRISAHQGVAGAVMQSGETLIIHDAYQDQRFNTEIDTQTGYRTRTILCVPLIDPAGERIGVVEVLNKLSGEFSDNDAKLLHALAAQAAITIEHGKLYERMQTLRDSEQQLSDEIKNQHYQLQAAYRQIESVNQELQQAVKKVAITRIGAAVVVIVLAVLSGTYHWSVGSVLQLVRLNNEITREDITYTGSFIIVEPKLFQSTILLSGHVAALDTQHILSPINGIVQQRNFEYGDYLHKNDVLLVIDTAAEKVIFRNAKAEYIKAQNHYNKLLNWEHSAEVAAARRALTRAKLNVASLQRKLAESKRLLEKGIIAAEEHAAIEQEILNQRLEYQAAQDALASEREQGCAEQVAIARLELENAQFAMQASETKLSFQQIRAPVDGVVLFPDSGPNRKRMDPGTSIEPGDLMVSIGNLEGITVISHIDEVDLRKIRSDHQTQKVLVTGEGFPDEELEGTITNISSRADSQQGKVPFFELTVTVPHLTVQQQKLIRIGMSATLEVVIYRNLQAISLPVSALEDVEGQWYVHVKEPITHSLRRVKVEIGNTNLEAVEIVRGLKTGDEVLLSSYEEW